MPTLIDFGRIKREADFSRVLAHYGFEVPAGRVQAKLPCPFHEESKPSLSVNLERGIWHCFGCDASGGLLDLVRRLEGATVRQAALRVAEICGLTGYEMERPLRGAQKAAERGSGSETINRPSPPSSPADGPPAGPQGRSDGPEEVNPPLSFTLKLDPEHPYLSQRGLSAETIEAFGLGYCSRASMKGRVCVPVHNEAGELVAYAGRWVGEPEEPPEGEGKWKLPPRFEKSRVLFNLHRVENPHHLVVVEGFFGAIRLHAFGLPAVALMGRTLSEHQLALLEAAGVRYVTLLLDGDEPGRQAVAEIMGLLAKRPIRVRAVMLPEGVQPDELSRAELQELLDLHGTWAFEPALS